MYDKREFLARFAEEYSEHKARPRAIWLTDTFGDSNGVSMSLRQNLRMNPGARPADRHGRLLLLRSSPSRISGSFRRSVSSAFPFYEDQVVRLPDFLELQRAFVEGAYTSIISSTEGPMGLASLYLRHAFQVPAHFFMHTDWCAFARQALGFTPASVDRLKRLLRLYYRGFEGAFVLNEEHRRWLTGGHMNLEKDRVHVTHHWLEPGRFRPTTTRREELFADVAPDTPLLLYVGRVSPEKGTDDLPRVLRRVRERVPDARLVVVGKGPAVATLRSEVEDLIHVPWVEQDQLAAYYSAADVLLLPSTFDTFGRVALEAISCGLPVAAYDRKGPREIIEDGRSGVLCKGPDQLGHRVAGILLDGESRRGMTVAALERSRHFDPERLMRRFLQRLNLAWPGEEHVDTVDADLEPVRS